jgi:protein TonB
MAAKDPFLTSNEKLRNYLALAFVGSLVVHAIASPFFPNLKAHHEDQQVEKVSVTKKIVVKVPTPPPPTPTPAPTPTPPPNQTPPPKIEKPVPIKVNVPVSHANSSNTASNEGKYEAPPNGSQNGVPVGQGQGTPAPPTPAACANPNKEASVMNAQQPDYPDAARDLGLGPVTALVEVTVGPSGNLISATIYKSAGNPLIDRAAITAAKQSTYSPKYVNCAPTAGDYLFRAEFSPD